MKIIIALLICTSLTTAQQISNKITLKAKNKLGLHKGMTKWREKMEQFNVLDLRKSQVDTLQIHNPSLTAVSAKAVEDAMCYDVPFASKGNTIEMSVANTSVLSIEEIKVEIINTPEWLKFTAKNVNIAALKAKEEQIAVFTFSVDKSAQVDKKQTLSFSITDKSGQQWMKDIAIKIAPPATYELFQNYPNPFNPTTTIEYQLPGAGVKYSVSLKIYDIIGREVMSLVNEQQEPGYYQKMFDARRYASGMYIYRLIATDEQNKKHIYQKKMILLR